MTKLTPILSGRCYVVEMPVGCDKTVAYGLTSPTPYINWMGDDGNIVEIGLPPGNWRIIGMLSEVTDAELADVTGFYYNKYNERYVEMPTSAMRATPIGDIEDAIRAEGYTFQSTPKPENKDFYWGYLDDLAKWEAAQSRVLDRRRCLLLGRIDG